MVTRIDEDLKQFMVTLMECDGLDSVAFQKLLNVIREKFALDVVYTLERISENREFSFRFMSVSKQEYDQRGIIMQLPEEEYEEAIRMYKESRICARNVSYASRFAISETVLHYGYIRRNNEVYDGSIGFQKFSDHDWTAEEKAALTKLGRVYGLLYQASLTRELNDHLFEALRMEEVLRFKAEHDALTGILNRRGFNRITRFLKKEPFPLALAMIDVDSFKQINDQYGHDVGDEVLIKIAKILELHFRSSDTVVRLGGDEFAILLNNIRTEQKEFLVEKIAQVNQKLKNPIDGLPPVTLTLPAWRFRRAATIRGCLSRQMRRCMTASIKARILANFMGFIKKLLASLAG